MSIKINDNLDLLYPGDDGFIVDDTLVRGGYTTVNTISERDAIPNASRKVGMVVNVVSSNMEYHLVAGISNSNWKQKIISSASLPGYVKSMNAELIGIATYEQLDQPSTNPITEIQPSYNNNPHQDCLVINISDGDDAIVGMGTVLKGVASGATANVISICDNGLIIPSKTATSDSLRVGDFIVGEKLVYSAGPAIARTDSQLMTHKAANIVCLSSKGGVVSGPIHNKLSSNYPTEGKVTTLIEHVGLGLAEVAIDFSITDLNFVNHNMNVRTSAGHVVTTMHLTSDRMGFLIKLEDKVKFGIGDRLMIINPVIIANQSSQLTTKQYVDDKTSILELDIDSSFFTNDGVQTDPYDNTMKVRYSYTIPSSIKCNRWPIVEIYSAYNAGGITEYNQVSPSNIRHVVRKTETTTDIVIQIWEVAPSTLKVVIH